MAYRDPLQELRDLMAREREALLMGRLEAFAGLAEDKARLAGKLSALQLDQATLGELRHHARRNGELLDAARRGLKNAGERLRQIRGGAQPLQTYGQQGQRYMIGAGSSSVSHRA